MFIRMPAILLLALPLACGDSSSADTDTDTNTDTTADTDTNTDTDTPPTSGSSSSGEPTTTGDASELYECEELQFGSSPLAGPGYDAAKGGIQGELQAGYVLHVTEAYLRPDQAEAFDAMSQQVGAEAFKVEGLVALSFGGDDGCGVVRTMGIWTSEEAMYKLVTSEVHALAMSKTAELTRTARTTHWTVTAAEANAYTWDVARAKLAELPPSPLY